MNKIKVKNIFAAVSDKLILDSLLAILDSKSVKFWGTEGTIKYLKSKGFDAQSVVAGFDFDGRVKSLDRVIFARILADRSNKKHLEELRKLGTVASHSRPDRESDPRFRKDDAEPIDLVVVDLYPLNKNNFPESMDIGGQALIRAAVKNFQNVALAFDAQSIKDLAEELKSDQSTTFPFRKTQAKKALEFIAERAKKESFSVDR